MAKRIYFIRHGESSLNADANRLSGISDVPMTEAGREHCRILSRFFEAVPVDAVYSSPLARAIETSALIFPDGPAAEVRGELIEFNYGEFDGVSIEELAPEHPVAMQWRDCPGDMTFPGGQSIREYADAVFEGMKRLIASTPAQRIACVGHKTMGRLFVAKVLGLQLNAFRAIPMDNCSITELAWAEEAGFSLRALNISIHNLLL